MAMASSKVDLASPMPAGSLIPVSGAGSADVFVYSSQEIQTSRPLTHRPSMSSNSISGGLSIGRQSHSRNNSHSVLSASLNGSHRVTRRKSMTNSGANVAAVAAALQEAGDKPMPLPIAINGRRHTVSRNGLTRSSMAGSPLSPPASLPTHKFVTTNGSGNTQDSAIDDDVNDMSGDEGDTAAQKARVRRASDGQPLVKEGRKSNRPELRCEKCGKGYKHSSCLTKHLFVPTLLSSLSCQELPRVECVRILAGHGKLACPV